ncbi:MAG: N-acetylglucosamine-6-phosphate deacetylase [Clostridia bacterium]|nr:N-acetylglucosamine-6-phosphate deacetylase [Clostridia bacterium]
MKYVKNGKIIMPDGEIEGKVLAFSDVVMGVVDENEIGCFGEGEVVDACGGIVSPGLVDIHIHGYFGEDSSDGSKEGILKISKELIKNGVTAFLPTTMTVSYEQLEKAFDVVRGLKSTVVDGAQVIGVNAEGPFISPKYKGAQKEDNIKNIDPDFLIKHSDVIRITTVAPEKEGAIEAIKKVKENTDIVFSMGHTSATYNEAKEGIKAGISLATHLFNAMTPLNHRDPGVVGAALTSEDVSCELIADTFHINADLFKMVWSLKKDKLILITDCTRAGGLEDGEYDLGGQMLTKKGVECRLADGTIAGSVLALNKALYNFRKHTGLKDYEVVSLASANPARLIGEKDRGTLENGKRADVVIFDNDFNVVKTYVGGVEKSN